MHSLTDVIVTGVSHAGSVRRTMEVVNDSFYILNASNGIKVKYIFFLQTSSVDIGHSRSFTSLTDDLEF